MNGWKKNKPKKNQIFFPQRKNSKFPTIFSLIKMVKGIFHLLKQWTESEISVLEIFICKLNFNNIFLHY